MAAESATADPNTAESPEVQDVNPTTDSEGYKNESTDTTAADRAPSASLDPSRAIAGSQIQDEDNSLDKRHLDGPHLLEEMDTAKHASNVAQDDNITERGYPEESELRSADLIQEIRLLREKVSKIEEQAIQQPSRSMFEAEWRAAAEAIGVGREMEIWDDLIQRRKEVSRYSTWTELDLPYRFDLDHIAKEMDKNPLYESDVLRWRKSWERKIPSWKSMPSFHERSRNLRQVFSDRRIHSRAQGPADSTSGWDSDSDGSLDFEFSLDSLRQRYLQKVDRLHEEREIRLHKRRLESRERARNVKKLQLEKEVREEELLAVRRAKEETKDQSKKDVTTSHAGECMPEEVKGKPPPPPHAVSKLNRVDWIGFKALQDVPEGDSFAIDVLIGEPEIAIDFSLRANRVRNAKQIDEKAKSFQEGNVNIKQPLASTGQSPLPERIRLHSKQLIRIIDKVRGEKTHTYGSLVIIRPFRSLMYYSQALRDWCQRLAKKYGTSETSKTISAETSTTELGSEKDPKNQDSSTSEQTPEDHAEISENDNSDNDSDDDPDDNLTTLQHLRCLLEFIDTDISSRLAHLSEAESKRIFFSDIWHLFKPGDEVTTSDGKQVYRVIGIISAAHRVVPYGFNYWEKPSVDKDEDTPIEIHCVHIDFDGKRLGPVRKQFTIKRFDNEKSITSLEVYPLRFHPRKRGEETNHGDNESFRQRLIARGRKFVEMAAVPHRHMYYAGPALETREDVESQVVVDFDLALSVEESKSQKWRPSIEEVIGAVSKESKKKEDCEAECCLGENIHDDTFVDKKRNEEYVGSLFPTSRERLPSVAVYPWPLQAIRSSEHNLLDEDMLIMSYRVFAFVLRTRKWEKLDLTHLSDVEGSENEREGKTAFDRLVLPPDHKEMVQSLIAQHFRDKESSQSKVGQFDIVRGKGKGLILLLHGAPGVGKTSTAEGVAELFKKPLFQITCGDLGTTASEVEKALETNFALANRWGSILLLDEADVFLAARNPKDFKRNGLVAVFLRVLEYYAGILFLTTNRIGDFDEAFASRIHISLYYPPLDKSSTEQVFRLNLEMIGERMKNKGKKIKINHGEIIKFAGKYWTDNAKARWNGRQIRNASQTALALAEFEAVKSNSTVKLSKRHIKRVATSYLDFTQYLIELYGTDDSRRATEGGLRAPEHARGFNRQEGGPNSLEDLSLRFASTGRQRATEESTLRTSHYQMTPQHSRHLESEPRTHTQRYRSPVAAPVSNESSSEDESDEESEEESEEEFQDDHTSKQPLYAPDTATMLDPLDAHSKHTWNQRQAHGGDHSPSRSKSKNEFSVDQGPSDIAHERFDDPRLAPPKKSRSGKNRKGRQ